MLHAIKTKKRFQISFLIILMVMTYGIPAGFHLNFCNGEEGHWDIVVANCIDTAKFSGHAEKINSSPVVKDCCSSDCCSNFSDCNSEINCYPALLLTRQPSASSSSLLSSIHSVATCLVYGNTTVRLLTLHPEISLGKLSVLRTIIVQV